MYGLEDDLLEEWRSAKGAGDAIQKITNVLSDHIDYAKPAHDDLADFATHLSLYSATKGPDSRGKLGSMTHTTNTACDNGYAIESHTATKKQPNYGSFMDMDNIFETTYLVGDEISYYGCDCIGSVNV